MKIKCTMLLTTPSTQKMISKIPKNEILKTYYTIEAEIKTDDAFVLKEMEKNGSFHSRKQ
jgi:hypothetical protein